MSEEKEKPIYSIVNNGVQTVVLPTGFYQLGKRIVFIKNKGIKL